ncbi:MAG: hypothetical protein HDR95_05105 [Bacteroides sp.]|nr:hypothetical protein [Bacteroides sp.]
MAEIKIPLLFAPNSYWLAKESLFGGKTIALVINKQRQSNTFSCKDSSQYEYLIKELKSLARFLNYTPITDVISNSEIEISETDNFLNFRYALNGILSFTGSYPNLVIESTHGFPGYKMPVNINGDTIICLRAKFNFANCQLDVEGYVKGTTDYHNEFMFVSREYKEIYRKLLRSSFLCRIDWVSRFMNFSPMINDNTVVNGIRNGYLRRAY